MDSWPSACGLFILCQAHSLMLGPFADNSELSYTTTQTPQSEEEQILEAITY